MGDSIVYRLTAAGVVIDKADDGAEDPFALFTEWASEEDDQAYADL